RPERRPGGVEGLRSRGRDAGFRQALGGEPCLRVQLADARDVEWVVTRGATGRESDVPLEELLLRLLGQRQRLGAGAVRCDVVAAQADGDPDEDGGEQA